MPPEGSGSIFNPTSTPKKQSLSAVDTMAARSISSPPTHQLKSNHLVPSTLPYPLYSNSERSTFNGMEELIPRRLTASPDARLRDKDRIRKRLREYHTFDDAVRLLKRARNVVVLTGAGISTSLDIPDFRSDDGFYSRLSSKIGITTPEEFFSVDFFKRESESFWENVRPLLPKHVRTTNGSYKRVDRAQDIRDCDTSTPRYGSTHAFLAMLQDRDKLLTNYTQNIDGLEFAAGVQANKAVQCHGSWDTASCMTCKKTISAKKYLPIVYQAGFPRCKCSPLDLQRKARPKKVSKKRKRLVYEGDSDHDSDDGTKTPSGLFKPDITFFGEAIPKLYVPRLESDKLKADLLIVIGTSLKVRPVKMMVTDFPPIIPQIWINRDRFSGYHSDMPGVQFDIELLGECDIVVEELCRRAGYKLSPFLWGETSVNIKSKPRHNLSSKALSVPLDADEVKLSGTTRNVREASATSDRKTSTTPDTTSVQKQIDVKGHSSGNNANRVDTLDGSQRVSTFTLRVEPPEEIPQPNSSWAATTSSQSTVEVPDDISATSGGNSPPRSDITTGSANVSLSGAENQSTIRIEPDLDAEWRWRFHRKQVIRK